MEPWIALVDENDDPIDPSPLPCNPGDVPLEEQITFVQIASEVMWALSGRRYGFETTIERPCRLDQNTCGRGICGVSRCHQVTLTNVPVSSITEVLIDGAVLASSAYRLDHQRYVMRVDGLCWPSRNDLLLATTEVGTWSIEYVHGLAIPAGGIESVKELSCELIAARKGGPCRLPKTTVSIARQGVSQQFEIAATFLERGSVGLPISDLWLGSDNPSKLRERSRFVNPDTWAANRRA